VLKILIADDHQMFREGVKSLFDQSAEYQVVAMTDSGARTVELARQLSPDIIIMDVGMPELNGIAATRRIRQELPGTQVIALSMHSERSLVLEMLKAGAAGYLLKDETFDELLKAIEVVRAGRTYIPPRFGSLLLQELSIGGAQKGLTPRETEVLKLLAAGRSAQQIAEALCISIKTVETHRSNIMKKLDLQNLADLTRYAIRSGLIEA
jgi:DNA-binding NarL/FixJ family response regulator